MKSYFFIVLICLGACQLDLKKKARDTAQTYRISAAPLDTAEFGYDIESETRFETEVDGKEVENQTTSVIGVQCRVRRDSLRNYIIDLTYDKVLIRTNNNGQKTELNAENAARSANPVEKLLGYLKGAKLTAVLNEKGQTKEVKGYKELGDQILASFASNDAYGKAAAQKQWEGMMRQQLVDNNLTHLFRFFPDSLVRVGDKWSHTTEQKDHFHLLIDNTYTLEDIEGGIAIIQVKGKIRTNENATPVAGFPVAADLAGEQEGEYQVDMATGLAVQSVLSSTTEGKIQTMGKEVPIMIKNNVTIRRRTPAKTASLSSY